MLETMTSDPIMEAIFEIRFTSSNDAVSSVLLGVLLNSFKSRFTNIERLPINDVPLAIRKITPNLQYAPDHRLKGENEVVQVGGNNLSIAVTRPYPGWDVFNPFILEVLGIAESVGVIETVSRVAFRYINLIERYQGVNSDYELINFEGELGKFDLKTCQTAVRLEIEENGVNHAIQVQNNSRVASNISEQPLCGLLLDIDSSISGERPDFWDKKDEIIESVRNSERHIFETVITSNTIRRYQGNG